MTANPTIDAPADGDAVHCYRHPDRETYVRCGRCDRPICPRCAMQGPVGFRCKSCGKPAYDPLTSIKPQHLVLGTLVSVLAGTVGGFIGLRIGFFVIFVGFFAGGIIADLVMRVTGYKRGPVMRAMLLGGIAVGTVIAVFLSYGLFLADIGGEDGGPMLSYLADISVWALVYAGAAMFGAWGRLRY